STSHQVDLSDSQATRDLIFSLSPTHIIHTAALARMDQCEQYPHLALQHNVEATRNIADAAADLPVPAHLVHISTDLVFDGKQAPYSEESRPSPLQIYGQSKADAESALRTSAAFPRTAILRSALIYGNEIGKRKCFLQW